MQFERHLLELARTMRSGWTNRQNYPESWRKVLSTQKMQTHSHKIKNLLIGPTKKVPIRLEIISF